MMRKILLLVFISMLGFACSTGQKEQVNEEIEADALTGTKAEEQVVIPSDSGSVRINLFEGKGSVLTRKEENQTIYVEFLSEGYKKVSAHLSSPDSLANVRISQIFLPDGTMDGPFARDMEYPLTGDGVYKISVHENMMAGDPWSGVFKVEIELTK